jgi:hypothetical protein
VIAAVLAAGAVTALAGSPAQAAAAAATWTADLSAVDYDDVDVRGKTGPGDWTEWTPAGTANGHVITSRDHFVALPSGRGLSPKGSGSYRVRVCKTDNSRCEYAPVWDVGPRNTKDDYWNPASVRAEYQDLPQGQPEAYAATWATRSATRQASTSATASSTTGSRWRTTAPPRGPAPARPAWSAPRATR